MYSQQYGLCHYDNSRVVISNRHFRPGRPQARGRRATTERPKSPSSDRQSIDPSFWGPPAWDFLLSVAASYGDDPTDADQLKMRNFLNSLKYALPCEACRRHYSRSLRDISVSDLQSSGTLRSWLLRLQEEIRARKEKRVVETGKTCCSCEPPTPPSEPAVAAPEPGPAAPPLCCAKR